MKTPTKTRSTLKAVATVAVAVMGSLVVLFVLGLIAFAQSGI